MTLNVLHFCTYFDRNYLIRGMAMIQSLAAHCPAARVWVLCLDDETHQTLTLLDLPAIRAIALGEFEQANQDLLAVKPERPTFDYYLTCTPSLPLFVFDHFPEVKLITYLDADLFFFADPAPLFAEIGNGSIGLVRQRMTAQYPNADEKYGIYNVAWVTFRGDAAGHASLRWWRARCIEWCYNRVEEGKFGDQKYLDDWPTRFANVVVLTHKGADLAPWNLANHDLTTDGARRVFVDEQPLIFFHFSWLTQVNRWLYNPRFDTDVKATGVLRRTIYGQYLRALASAEQSVKAFTVIAPLDDNAWRELRQVSGGRAHGVPVLARLRRLLGQGKRIATGRLLVCIRGRVI